ncbi:MAG: nucleoside deaminase [Cytophagales bacterium]|jgi:tRNA(Arg) A34 adenosine deaminase TadA|nr:nucleoside deaminase [Sinomicrobium oceani]MBR9774372.1 nucleoside deaminase [Cytophagales bacterium]RUA11065.1 MAG: nucleoside deaminase [Flavobacteriia bacterium]|tara:strand:+ start:1814 stop:2320 length:507 start_codon:yes stop_codon:yes gene_type:complete
MNEIMDQDYHPKFMLRAIELSKMAYKSGKGLPIGCVIVRNGKIIGEGHNEIFERVNPTSHGEMVAIERACRNINDLQLSECQMYTTLEPCPMCLGAIYWAKIHKVYYANTNADAAKVGFDDTFIFDELRKSANERKINFLYVPDKNAITVLEEWKSKDLISAQPWNDK